MSDKPTLDEIQATINKFQESLLADRPDALARVQEQQAKVLADKGEKKFVETAYSSVKEPLSMIGFVSAMYPEPGMSAEADALRAAADDGYKLRDLCEAYLGIEVKQ